MKILYITLEGFDVPSGNSHLMLTMLTDFLDAGIDISMICSQRQDFHSVSTNIFKRYKGFVCNIIKRPTVHKSKLIKRYIEECVYVLKTIKYLVKNRDCDIVFIQSFPCAIFQIVLTKMIVNKPIVFNIYDMFPGTAINTGVVKSSITKKFFFLLQKVAYKLSTKIVVMSEDMKEKVCEQSVDANKIEVIYNWYDQNAIKEISVEENKFIQKYDIDTSKFYVQYAGNMGYVFDYKAILFSAQRTFNCKNIIYQIIGSGNQLEKFQREANELLLDNIVFLPWQPLDIIADVYSACDICLIPLKPGVIGNSVPSKAALLMACGKVVLNSVDNNSNYFHMFNSNQIGISVSNLDYSALSDSVEYLYNNKHLIESMGQNAKKYGYEYFRSGLNTKKFIDLFNIIYDCGGKIQ